MSLINNPFIVYGYKGPTYFCDRRNETERVLRALGSERNVTLVAPRRMGKTGLIQHIFHQIAQQEPEVKCFYVDIYATHSLAQLVHLLAQTIVGRLDNVSQATLRGIQTSFSSWRPKISIDPLSGLPTVTLDIQPAEGRESLRRVFEYMQQSGRRCYVAIDEFQQILNYPEKGVEALIRSYIQFLPNVYFLFSGSQQHLMQQMFLSANRPFFQSSMVIALEGIDREEYRAFANGHLAAQGGSVDKETFDYLYEMAGGITWYVQAILHGIYQHRGRQADRALVDEVIDEWLGEQSVAYQNYCAWLTANQLALLRAIASEGKVSAPLSQAFIVGHRLPAPSSVKAALRALEDKMLVARSPRGYSVCDRFFSLWLCRG